MSLGEPMLGNNKGWTRRGVPFWEVNRSDSTMAPSFRDPDLLPRLASIGWTKRGAPFCEVNRSDSTMAPSWRDPDLLTRVAIAVTVEENIGRTKLPIQGGGEGTGENSLA